MRVVGIRRKTIWRSARVEARVPGSLQELHHPPWAVLKRQPSCATLSESFLLLFKSDVHAVLFEPVDWIEVYGA